MRNVSKSFLPGFLAMSCAAGPEVKPAHKVDFSETDIAQNGGAIVIEVACKNPTDNSERCCDSRIEALIEKAREVTGACLSKGLNDFKAQEMLVQTACGKQTKKAPLFDISVASLMAKTCAIRLKLRELSLIIDPLRKSAFRTGTRGK